ncbi:MAG: hypothetical protein J0H61_14085, partial [Alphaproteobacteria bacterium]|nr:hypothetical protein [Alphaproteobacteria bacterium]
MAGADRARRFPDFRNAGDRQKGGMRAPGRGGLFVGGNDRRAMPGGVARLFFRSVGQEKWEPRQRRAVFRPVARPKESVGQEKWEPH